MQLNIFVVLNVHAGRKNVQNKNIGLAHAKIVIGRQNAVV